MRPVAGIAVLGTVAVSLLVSGARKMRNSTLPKVCILKSEKRRNK